MDICIRADGGTNIGMGHVMRTLVLAQTLRENHNVFYACKIDEPCSDKYLAGIDLIQKQGFKVAKINENDEINELKKIRADCIITDSYDIDEEYFTALKKIFKISGCFDDECICSYYNVDFLINQNIYASIFDYRVNENTELMLGAEYVILREEFRALPDKVIKKSITDIMVTVGGSDQDNITGKIVNLVKSSDYNYHIVVGPGFNCIEELMKNKSNKIKFYYNPKMSALMNQCDLAISSCGSTLYELAATGTPTIGIVVADNQKIAAQYMSEMGLIKYSRLDYLLADIETMTYDYRKTMSIANRKIVDGFGVFRIKEKIEKRLIQ